MTPPRYPTGLMPKPRAPRVTPPRPKRGKIISKIVPVLIAAVAISAGIFSLPLILVADVKLAQKPAFDGANFPVTVDPGKKLIYTDPEVELLLKTRPTQLPAAV